MNSARSTRIALLGVLLWFLTRNLLVPLAFDDYCYAFVWDGAGNLTLGAEPLERIESVSDVLRSQWTHYFVWGGRTVAHVLVQLLIWAGKFYFDLLNTVIFAALIVLINRLASSSPLTLRKLIWIVGGLWLATPEFMYSMLWLTGSVNYLWMTVLQLLFIYFYSRSSIPNAAFLIPTGLLVGWSNEAGAGTAILLAAYFTYTNPEGRAWKLIGLISALVGLALMILAPGNLARMHYIFPDGFRFTSTILLEHAETLLEVVGGESVLLIPILMSRSTLRRSMPFLIAALLIPAAMMFSPLFKPYAAFASTVYLLIASTTALDRLNFSSLNKIFVILGVVLSCSMLSALIADFRFHGQVQTQFELIEERRGSDTVTLPPMEFDPTLDKIFGARVLNHYVGEEFGRHIMGLSTDPDFYYNRAAARYFGLNRIAIEGAQ